MERFIVRPGIGLTVEYGEDHQVCEAIIEVPRPIGNEISENTPMDQNAANDVLEEIAPATARGNQVEDVWFQASCGVVRFTYYENLSIRRGFSPCWFPKNHEEQDSRITVTFNRALCPKRKDQAPARIK
jgi:hypothetical protein